MRLWTRLWYFVVFLGIMSAFVAKINLLHGCAHNKLSRLTMITYTSYIKVCIIIFGIICTERYRGRAQKWQKKKKTDVHAWSLFWMLLHSDWITEITSGYSLQLFAQIILCTPYHSVIQPVLPSSLGIYIHYSSCCAVVVVFVALQLWLIPRPGYFNPKNFYPNKTGYRKQGKKHTRLSV